MPPVSFLMWVVHVFALCLPVSPGPCSFHGSSQWADSRLTYKVTNKLIKNEQSLFWAPEDFKRKPRVFRGRHSSQWAQDMLCSGVPQGSNRQLDRCPSTHYQDMSLRGTVEDRERSWDHDELAPPGDKVEVSASQRAESWGREGSVRTRLMSLAKHGLQNWDSTAPRGVGPPSQLTSLDLEPGRAQVSQGLKLIHFGALFKMKH